MACKREAVALCLFVYGFSVVVFQLRRSCEICFPFFWSRENLLPASLDFGPLGAGFALEPRSLTCFLRRVRNVKLSGNFSVVLVVVESSMGKTLRAHLCGLRQGKLQKWNLVFVCLDEASLATVELFGYWGVLVRNADRMGVVTKYCLKIALAYFTVAMGLDCYVCDCDVIFLGEFWQ